MHEAAARNESPLGDRAEPGVVQLQFLGETLVLDPAGALFWPARRLLAVADLHLEKGSACARQGRLVPPWDSALTLERLSSLAFRYRPATAVLLGDTFHDGDAPARLREWERSLLAALAGTVSFVCIAGNHDRGAQAANLPGRAADVFALGPITFRHEAIGEAPPGEISGHFHPKASVATRAGTSITRPCFVASACKIMLPAFGAYTGGLDIRAPAIRSHFPDGGRAYLLGRDRVFGFSLG